MTPLGHLAIGFAAKPAGPKIHLGVLLAASWLLDLLYFIFAFAGLESIANLTKPGAVPSPYSHGLFMALVWTTLAGLLAWRIYRSRRAGLVIGLVVFSHWILDFISWNNLYLFFEGSPQVGLGLFNSLGSDTLYIELALFLAGMTTYLISRKRKVHICLKSF
jgi:membrane-bound metal-dependent hydrolase YbcI (DUF457 family)